MFNFRYNIKWKIFTGSILLSMIIVALNVGFSMFAIRRAGSQQQDLQKVMRRYNSFQQHIATSDVAALGAWAASARELREALAKGDSEKALTLVRSVEKVLTEELHPDFFVVVGKHNDATLSEGAPVTLDDVRGLQLFADARARKLRGELLNLRGRGYLVSAVPIVDGTGSSVGAIVIGRKLEDLYKDFQAQWELESRKRPDFALVSTEGSVLASTFPRESWEEFAQRAARPPEVESTGGVSVQFMQLHDGAEDFHVEMRNGYDGPRQGNVGKLFILRDHVDRHEQIESLAHQSLGLGACAVALGFLVSFLIALGITRPIKKLIAATAAIADGEGDLTKRLEVCSKDELGELAVNLNKVFANLQSLAAEAQRAALHVGGSSGEISAASRQMLAGAKEQALKIESSTAAVTELSSSIQQVADNALQATKVAKESGDQVQTAIDGMARIRATVEEASEKIHDLGESGKRIGNIVEVIRQISEQTSLLALNASIEAAHAGEQGRGFAVVADEVSSLAKRVGQSAKDIEDLIATIKDQTGEAVTSMQSGNKEVESGTKIVVHTLESLQRIIEVIQDTANAVQEQAVVSDEIARNMDAVQKIAQEVLAASEAAVTQGENLDTLARALEDSVQGFRIEEDGAPPMTPPPRRPPPAGTAGGGNQRPTRAALPPASNSASDRRRAARG